MRFHLPIAGFVAAVAAVAAAFAAEETAGDPARGAQVFRACGACHSLRPDKSMTGPSLAGLWGRKAGTLPSFARFSPALKSSGIVWDDRTLDDWLRDPAHDVPGNRMTFPGIKKDQPRHDLLAFLKESTQPGAAPSAHAERQEGQGMMGGMGGMMGGAQDAPSLKKLDPDDRVASITYCRDTYRVATADGETHEFWERNLRFKTDASEDGPEKDAPAIVGSGMMGDRASIVFAAPGEISAWIKPGC